MHSTAEVFKNCRDTANIVKWKSFWKLLALWQLCYNKCNFMITPKVRISPCISMCLCNANFWEKLKKKTLHKDAQCKQH
jgi:hypothetical protein